MNRFFLVFSIFLTILAISNRDLPAIEVLDEIIVSVNNNVITREQLEENIRIFKKFGAEENEFISDNELKIMILSKIIDDYLLREQAEEQDIAVPTTNIQKALDDFKGKMPQEKFVQSLNQEGITLEGLNEKIKQEFLGEKVIKWKATQLQEEIQIKNNEVEQFFISLKNYIEGAEEKNEDIIQFAVIHQQQLMAEEKIQIAQIILDTQEQAKEIIEYLAEGEDFFNLAKRFSSGPNAQKGGELGWVSLAQIQNPLRSILSELKEGESTSALKINDESYQIIQVKQREQLSFKKWKDKIKDYLFNTEMMKLLNEWVKNLKEKSFIKIMDEDLKKEWKD